MSLFGAHWIPTHTGQSDQEQFRRQTPGWIKIVEHFSPDNLPSRTMQAYQWSPRSMFVLRDHPLSEQHDDMMREPEATGRRHAEDWGAKLAAWKLPIPREQVIVCGINEPHVWQTSASTRGLSISGARNIGMAYVRRSLGLEPGIRATENLTNTVGIDRTVRYTVSLASSLAKRKIRGSLLNLAVGWPANNGPDTPPDWGPYTPIYDVMKECWEKYSIMHVLTLHQYWPWAGPESHGKWLAYRHEWLKWNIPIALGECGVTQRTVDGSIPEARSGWIGNLSESQYWRQWQEFMARLERDKRIQTAMGFTWDGGDPWIKTDDMRAMLKYFPTNTKFDYVLDGSRWFKGGDPQPPQNGISPGRLNAMADTEQRIHFNPDAALQRQMRIDGYVPNSNEFSYTENGQDYVAQRSEKLGSVSVRVYYVPIGQWDKVKYTQRP